MNIGPLLFSTAVLALLFGVLAGMGTNAFLRRRGYADVGNAALLALAASLVVARIAFVLRWWPQYAQDPWSMLNVRDAGFDVLAGVTVLALAGVLIGWRRPAWRRPLAAVLVVGALAWGLGSLAARALSESQQPLPVLTLRDLQGRPVALQDLRGQPTVINLWATWCGPCRREMPMLARAQAAMPHVRFVFADQGESIAAVQRYLELERLELGHVLLDPHMDVSTWYGARGYPTTLFIDAQGALRDTQVGELSAATLAAHLARITP
ncbi:MAG: TlpA family protein disulfide reductase [Xanthomonadales bacterium]|nr:TlpA family protein disulfide reductase [Xanthomonadales bacterium]